MTTETPQGQDGPAPPTLEAELPPRIEEARQRFEQWRRTRPAVGPIPAELWSEAASCAAQYGAYRTARALGLDSGKLKRLMSPGKKHRRGSRVKARPAATFVEVAPPPRALPAECVLEVESRTGTRLRIHLRGTPLGDLAELARSLTREGP